MGSLLAREPVPWVAGRNRPAGPPWHEPQRGLPHPQAATGDVVPRPPEDPEDRHRDGSVVRRDRGA